MTFRRMATVTVIVVVSTLTALSASASEVLFTGSGVFGPGTSTLLPVEVPNGVFSFSFDLPNP